MPCPFIVAVITFDRFSPSLLGALPHLFGDKMMRASRCPS